MKENKQKLVIVGGGTSGWMCAAAFSRTMGSVLDITLIESDDIPTVGVGEATIPLLTEFHKLIGVDEREFMRRSNGTFKLGIYFEDWKDLGSKYLHGFGAVGKDSWVAGFHHFWLRAKKEGADFDFSKFSRHTLAAKKKKVTTQPGAGLNYAYHLDAKLYSEMLREISENRGVNRLEGKVTNVNLDSVNGNISSLTLANGESVSADLFIDCTGFRGLLIEDTLKSGFEDWSHWLPCDRAVAAQSKTTSELLPYTRCIAREAGWQWRIPLQNRMGNGYVYSSKFIDDEAAIETFKKNVDGELLNEPRVIRFTAGRRKSQWVKNCVSIGLSSGFIEPLESTSLHLVQSGIMRLIKLYPMNEVDDSSVKEYNEQSQFEFEMIRDFIIMHYKVTNREDTPFWHYCKNMDVPETLEHRLQMFKENGCLFRIENELFFEHSWAHVMIEQGLVPEKYHPIVEIMSNEDLNKMLDAILKENEHMVGKLPEYSKFLKDYLKVAG